MQRTSIYKMIKISCLAFAAVLVFFSCKREEVEVIGPELAIASPNFQITTPFQYNSGTSDFTIGTNWFNATFNERVSWEIKITGNKSKAVRIIKGISAEINQTNSSWSGTHSDLYFFRAGEQATAELTVFGSNEKWTSTTTILKEKNNYGPDVLIWCDMFNTGIAREGQVYWWDDYDGNDIKKADFNDSSSVANDPVQGPYRSMHGVDKQPTNYWIGVAGHTPLALGAGFVGASIDEVFLNFYVRRRTSTTNSMSVELVSDVGGVNSTLRSSVEMNSDGWNRISIRLSDMELETGNPTFDPSKIIMFRTVLGIYPESGFDIDFITFTKGAPFNPANIP